MEFKLPTSCLDDLFSTQEMRDDAQLAKIRDIPLSEIDTFPGHPFQVRDDEEMQRLCESIKEQGVITPATVRQKPDGRYELISGHRRKRACELAGLTALRCEVVDIDDDEAVIRMVESNFYREKILPSEKAFSYKMRLEAMNRQAGRPPKDNLTPVVSDLDAIRTNEKFGKEVGESREQIRRYIRLTYLIQPLLSLTDMGKLKLRTAVELSYLDKESQRAVFETAHIPSLKQACELRRLCEQQGGINGRDAIAFFGEPQGGKPKPVELSARLRKHIPAEVPLSDAENYICAALEYYAAHISKT